MSTDKSKNITIPHEAKRLDDILAKCRWRFSNHYAPNEWNDFAKTIAGSDANNPLFEAYVQELEDEKLIKIAPEGPGYIATAKGLMFKGYSQTIIDNEKSNKQKFIQKMISHAVTIGAVLLGALVTWLVTPKEPKTVVLPSIQIVRDTVIVHDTLRIPIESRAKPKSNSTKK